MVMDCIKWNDLQVSVLLGIIDGKTQHKCFATGLKPKYGAEPKTCEDNLPGW